LDQKQSVRRVTLYDVATRAGVSYQTVSRVINNSSHVAPETRKRVLQAIEALDYRPNEAARSLNTRRSQVLQTITFDVAHNQAVEAMLYTAKQLGYDMAFSAIWDLSSDKEVREQLDGLAARLIDGVVMITPSFDFSYEELVKFCRGIPAVLVGPGPAARAPAVMIDQRYGTNLALQHLFQLGHTRIAEISGDSRFYDARARHDAYCDFMRAHGLEPGPSVEGNFWADGGYNGVQQLVRQGPRFTALFCANDETAVGALLALEEHGLRVPEDISVIGFDDTRSAAFLKPPLTTVQQDFYAMGKEAVEYLVAMIKNPGTTIHQRVLYPRLMVRRSTTAPNEDAVVPSATEE
jgi:DNA-binding LacI/PurR family transcriptional regulator